MDDKSIDNNLNEREVNYKFDGTTKEYSVITEEAVSKIGLPLL